MGRAVALSGRRRSGDRQWRYRAGESGHCHWPRELDVLRQRQWRQDSGRVVKLHRDVQAECGRTIRLVPGRAHPHSHPPYPPNRGTASAQLENPRHRPSSLKFKAASIALARHPPTVVYETLTHISPLGWEHITITGTYHWKGVDRPWGRFHPLRQDAIDPLKAKNA